MLVDPFFSLEWFVLNSLKIIESFLLIYLANFKNGARSLDFWLFYFKKKKFSECSSTLGFVSLPPNTYHKLEFLVYFTLP